MQCVLDQARPTCICRQLSTTSNFHSSENMETLALVYFYLVVSEKKGGEEKAFSFYDLKARFFVCLFVLMWLRTLIEYWISPCFCRPGLTGAPVHGGYANHAAACLGVGRPLVCLH